jgi:hypothetical protein
MQNDTNTHGYTQWFYFSVKGMKKGTTYQFNVVNYVLSILIKIEKETLLL